MTRRVFLVALLASASATAFAVPPPPPLVIHTTTSITLRIAGPDGRTHETVDLAAGELQDRDPDKPATVRARRKLAAGEVTALRKAWLVVLNAERAEPSDGPAPGGSWHYEVVDARGPARLVSFHNGVPKGQRYIEIDDPTSVALLHAWPRIAPPSPKKPTK